MMSRSYLHLAQEKTVITHARKAVARPLAAAGRVAWMTCVLAAVAGCGDLELPPAPDMSALVRSYDEPDGELTTENAVDVGLRMAGTVVEAKATSPIELVGEMVNDLQATSEAEPDPDADPSENESESEDEAGPTLLGEKLDVAGIIRLHHVCRGWEGKVPPNEGLNGSLDLTATLDREGLIPTVWGTMNTCRHEPRIFELELDGDIRIRLGSTESRINLGDLDGLDALVEFEGRAAVRDDGQLSELDLHTHFRILPGEQIQFLIVLDDGSAVVGVFDTTALSSDEPTLTGGLITRDATWTCSIELNNAHGSCTDINDPTSTIDW